MVLSYNKKVAKCCTQMCPILPNSDGKLLWLLLQAHGSFGLRNDMSGSVVEESAFMKNI